MRATEYGRAHEGTTNYRRRRPKNLSIEARNYKLIFASECRVLYGHRGSSCVSPLGSQYIPVFRRHQVEVSRIIAEIDGQIAKLQQARALLAEGGAAPRAGRGRPKGSKDL